MGLTAVRRRQVPDVMYVLVGLTRLKGSMSGPLDGGLIVLAERILYTKATSLKLLLHPSHAEELKIVRLVILVISQV
jgi:hypothetical protein